MLSAKSIERLVALADQLDEQGRRDFSEVIDQVLDMANTAVTELSALHETQGVPVQTQDAPTATGE